MKHYRWNTKTFARNVIFPLQFCVGFLLVLCAPGIEEIGQAALLSGTGLLLISGMLAL